MKRLRYHLRTWWIFLFVAFMLAGLYFTGWAFSNQPLSSYNRDKLAAFKNFTHLDRP